MKKKRSRAPAKKTTEAATEFAIGHQPHEKQFRVFQSNLLSLISHELRTPLTGILNALTLLEEGRSDGLSMARRNAHRLQHALNELLDLAAIESGTLQVRLREIDLARLIQGRVQVNQSLLRDMNLKVLKSDDSHGFPVLADPQKLGRVVDLCLEILANKSPSGSSSEFRISSTKFTLEFELSPGGIPSWESAWMQALVGLHSGVATSGSLFSGIFQSEQGFLTRTEEGLGSELLIIQEIVRLHDGKMKHERKDHRVILQIELPELSSEQGLRAVLGSRTRGAGSELAVFALGLIRVPQEVPIEEFRIQIQKSLFRASDAVYALPAQKLLALVLDDCKPQDAPSLLKRLEKALNRKLQFGIATCPLEGSDPESLIQIAETKIV